MAGVIVGEGLEGAIIFMLIVIWMYFFVDHSASACTACLVLFDNPTLYPSWHRNKEGKHPRCSPSSRRLLTWYCYLRPSTWVAIKDVISLDSSSALGTLIDIGVDGVWLKCRAYKSSTWPQSFSRPSHNPIHVSVILQEGGKSISRPKNGSQ